MIIEKMFLDEAKKIEENIINWRRSLHQIPEIGTKLPKTMEYISSLLDEMEIPYEKYEDISCIVATIGKGEKCFLLRSDVDAIPVTEETELEYKSTNGNMHGCGHDLHGAILLGAAKILKDHEESLNGVVKLFFQSGEETFQGAKAAIEAGLLENPKVDAAFAMHVIAMMPMGLIMTGKEAMSSVDGFKITLNGKCGHGSMPEDTIDPINAAVQVYLALQSLIAREIGGTEEAVLTIGQISAGDAPNVIPERAVMQGTLRTFSPSVRDRLKNRILEVTKGVAETYRCNYEYEVLSDCPSVITDECITDFVEKRIIEIIPNISIVKEAHGMGSEDFAEIAQRVPSAYYLMGASPVDESKRLGQHNPKIEFNEDVLCVGSAIYAKVAFDWVNN